MLHSQFHDDPFMVPQYLWYLFSHLPSSLYNMSEDAIWCWISAVEEAKAIQTLVD